MNLRKEVLHRLLLAKFLLSTAPAASLGQPNSHVVAKQVLSVHDAADLVFAAIADHQSKMPALEKLPSMIPCLKLIDATGAVLDTAYFVQLNSARNNLKHSGNLPNAQQWASVVDDVLEKLSSLCQTTLGRSLREIDELELLVSDKVKAHLFAAKEYAASGQFKFALEEVGKALFVALDEHPNFWEIQVGRPKAEDALKLTAYGVSAGDFLRLQEFLPEVSKFLAEPFEISWRQSRFGHPGNWREEVVSFCLNACMGVALCIQSAQTIPEAVKFEHVYRYKITAKEDGVEVWEDIVQDHLSEIGSGNSRPFRTPKRILRKGESVTGSASTHPLVSDDLSPEGEEIKRVQIPDESLSILGKLYGVQSRAEFVNLAQVDVTCTPHKGRLFEKTFPGLREISWEQDPPA